MSQARPSAAHRRAARARTGREAPAATARANTAPSSATPRVPARSRARQQRRQPAISCGLAGPTVVRSSGLVPAPPALRAAPAQQSPDRRPIGASQPPVSASDSSCHNVTDSTPVLLPNSSVVKTTSVPSRKAESQLPLGGTRRLTPGVGRPPTRFCREAILGSRTSVVRHISGLDRTLKPVWPNKSTASFGLRQRISNISPLEQFRYLFYSFSRVPYRSHPLMLLVDHTPFHKAPSSA